MEDYRQPKPEWIKVHIKKDQKYRQTASLLKSYSLNTICSSGNCPNIKECWKYGTATFMILGEICTRACKFCNTATGKPMPPDPDEPQRLAKAAVEMGLRYIVVTSVDRDDPVSYTHLRAHETPEHLVCRLLLEKKKTPQTITL